MLQIFWRILKRNNKTLKVDIHQGDNAFALLENSQFRSNWEKLYRQCTWATGFQSPNYASTWYKVYRHQFTPLIFTRYDSKNRVTGIFTLAFSPDEKRLLGAGDRQAEYHTWLTPPDQQDTFILEVLNRLDQIHPGLPLTLKYLSPGTPIDCLRKGQGLVSKRCELEPFKRNFLHLDDKSKVETYVRSKKRLKTKMNNLKRAGKICFQRIISQTEFETALKEIIPLFDFRQGAVNGVTPFRSNPLKRSFFLELFKSSNLHVTVLTLDGQVISALMSFYDRGVFPLGEIVHSAFMHKFSPGALHLLMVVQLLANEDFKEFDLTPGGDAYKDRMASGSGTVYALTLHENRKQHIISRTNKRLNVLGQNILSRLPDEGARIKRIFHTMHSPAMIRKNISNIFLQPSRKSAVYYIYSLASTQVKAQNHSINISKNNIADLLLFKPSEGGQAAWLAFLSESWKHIHKGAHLYTSTENNNLEQLVWVLERYSQIVVPPETDQRVELPENTACLFGFYSNALQSNNNKTCGDFLSTVMTELLENNTDLSRYYLEVPKQDTNFRSLVEQLGCTLENTGEQERTTP